MINHLRLVVLFLVSGAAFGAAPDPSPWFTAGGHIGASAGPVCALLAADIGPSYGSKIVMNGTQHVCHVLNQSGSTYTQAIVANTTRCKDGSAPNTTKPLAEQCPDPLPPEEPTNPCTDKNPFVRKFLFGTGAGAASLPTALAGCLVTVKEVLVCRTETISGIKSTYCMLELVRTGEQGDNKPGEPPSSPATDNPVDPTVESPPLTPDGSQCPTGTSQVGASASGKPICVGGGTAPGAASGGGTVTTSPPVATSNPDGSTSVSQTVSKTNADGSVTTTTTITKTAADGTKSVSQSASTSANAAGGAGTPTDPNEQNFCKQNPMLNVCRNSNVNGTCGDIACSGDAIQCATLRATAAMQCAQDKDREDMEASETTQFGKALVSGNDPMTFEIGEMLEGDEIDMSGGANLDSSGFLPSACLGSKTFTVMGRQVIVHFASVCDSITPLRYVIMAIALIASYMIVGKSILQG